MSALTLIISFFISLVIARIITPRSGELTGNIPNMLPPNWESFVRPVRDCGSFTGFDKQFLYMYEKDGYDGKGPKKYEIQYSQVDRTSLSYDDMMVLKKCRLTTTDTLEMIKEIFFDRKIAFRKEVYSSYLELFIYRVDEMPAISYQQMLNDNDLELMEFELDSKWIEILLGVREKQINSALNIIKDMKRLVDPNINLDKFEDFCLEHLQFLQYKLDKTRSKNAVFLQQEKNKNHEMDESESQASKKIKLDSEVKSHSISYPESIPEDVDAFFVMMVHSDVDNEPSLSSNMMFRKPFSERDVAIYALCHVFTPERWICNDFADYRKFEYSEKDTNLLEALSRYILDESFDDMDYDDGEFIEWCKGNEDPDSVSEDEDFEGRYKRYVEQYIPPVFRPLHQWLYDHFRDVRMNPDENTHQTTMGNPFRTYKGSFEGCSKFFNLISINN